MRGTVCDGFDIGVDAVCQSCKYLVKSRKSVMQKYKQFVDEENNAYCNWNLSTIKIVSFI